MYVPALAEIFNIHPLGVDIDILRSAPKWSVVVPTDFTDWKIVLVFSIPVLFLDEALKLLSRFLGQ